MSKSTTWTNDLLLLVFNNATSSLHGDATGLRGSTAAGVYWISLHTADPGSGATQSTNEVAYTGYARASVSRAPGPGGFTVSGSAAAFSSNVDFPLGSGGTGTATHFQIGTSQTGFGKALYRGAITPNIACGNGVAPRILAGTVVTES